MAGAPKEPLAVHSLAEAYLYLMATACARCGEGPLKGADATRVTLGAEQTGGHQWRIAVVCSACRVKSSLRVAVRIAQPAIEPSDGDAAIVNPTDEPSRVLDVGQWIVLFRMIAEAASQEKDRVEARHLGLEAAQCLDEALKFYDDPDNDLPPPNALFHPASRERFRQAPQQFSRQRLLDLRAKLPSARVMRSRLASGRRRTWWKRRR